jgi:phage-related holin
MKIKVLGTILSLLGAFVFPKGELLLTMGICIVLDFITGIVKAIFQQKVRTSSGYRQTVLKFLQYGSAICVGVILSALAEFDKGTTPILKAALSYLTNGTVVFIIYIELTSIIENVYACDPNSIIAKRFFKPLLNLLTWQIGNNNPATKLPTDGLDKKE